jgi:ubiquinone/menaquinone biosynthesis C-methylase UbiE
MTIVLLVILLWLLCLIVSFGVYYFYHYYQGYKASEWVPYLWSFTQHLNLIKKSKLIQPHKTWIDLGSGDGKALRYFTQHFGAKECIWYEINKQAVWTANIKNRRYNYKTITYHHHNFISNPRRVEREKADIIYLYLFSHIMSDITTILSEHAKSGTIIVCNTFPLRDRTWIQLKEELMVDSKARIFIYIKS